MNSKTQSSDEKNIPLKVITIKEINLQHSTVKNKRNNLSQIEYLLLVMKKIWKNKLNKKCQISTENFLNIWLKKYGILRQLKFNEKKRII